MAMNPRLLKPTASGFSPRSISGLALWLDASSTDSLFTTDAGPVVPVRDPLDIAGCALWLDGADATSMFDATSGGSQVAAGGAIARWQDKSGNGRNFVQSTSTLRPLLTASGRNGRSVVTFDATDDYMISAATQNIPQPATWMFVYKVPSSIASGWSLVDSTTDRVHVYSAAGSTITQFTAGGFFTTEASGVTADQWRIGTYHFNGASSLGKRDGVQTATGTTGTNAITGSITLGSNNGGAAVLRSQMAEAILLTGASMADIARVESYLAAKWGISGVHAPATATSDPVGYWGDKSGNGRHAVQSLAGSRPLVSTAAINSRNALLLDGSNDLLNLGNLASAFPSAATLFVACAPQVGAGSPTSWSTFSTGGNSWEQYPPGVTYSSVFRAARVNAVPTILPYNGAAYQGSSLIIRYRSSSSGWGQFVNGGVSAIAAANYSAALNNSAIGYTIGADTSGGGVNGPFKGRICEVLAYNESLSDSQCERIERWLSQKWSASFGPRVSNPDAQDWIRRVYVSGGTVSPTTAGAVNQFCQDLENAPGGSIRDRFFRLNLFCGGTSGTAVGLNSALVPLFRGPSLGGTQYGGTTDTNSGGLFVSGDYSETVGLTPSGGVDANSTKYLNTGFSPSDIADTGTGHISAWKASGAAGPFSTPAIMGADAAGGTHRLGLVASTSLLDVSFAAGVSLQSANAYTGNGLVFHTRRSSSEAELYFNGSSVAVDTTARGYSGNTTDFAIFNRLQSNNTVFNSVGFFHPLLCYSVGASMTFSQQEAYYNALRAMFTSIGRTIT